MWSSRETFRFAHQAEHQLFFDVCQTLSESPRLTTGSVSLKPAPRMFAEVPADAWFEMFLLSTRSVDDESACLADCLLSVADWWVARCFSTYLDDLSRLVCRVCADLFKYYDYTAAGTPNTHFGIKCPDSPFLKTGIWSFHQPWSVIVLTFSLPFPFFCHVLLEIAVWGLRVCILQFKLFSGCCHRARARVSGPSRTTLLGGRLKRNVI